jgi:hypothetical protein
LDAASCDVVPSERLGTRRPHMIALMELMVSKKKKVYPFSTKCTGTCGITE